MEHDKRLTAPLYEVLLAKENQGVFRILSEKAKAQLITGMMIDYENEISQIFYQAEKGQ
jgi:hypothetical protein